jgi:phosphoribosylanthranilate isomerase
MRTRLKICCISSHEEAALAVAAGADALGFVGPMPSGAGIVADELIAEVAPRVPPPVTAILLTSRTDPEAIVAHAQAVGVGTVQIVSHVAPAAYPALRRAAPRLKLVQVVHVEDETSVALAETYAALADALLLDSGRPSAAVAELGGTGRVHDWALSRRIVERARVPVFLAGGLNPGNVAEAVAAVRPFGVDVCSGLRREGRLDAAKVRAFTRALWG